ncbi:MAG: DUF167 domain-containing protein [Candidatus Hodarchaeota archaeon]
MIFLEKHSDTIYTIRLNVKTNSKNQKIIYNGDSLTIYLHSKPIQNKANKELINLIKWKLKISSHQIQIISGLKAQNKLIKITFLEKTEEQELFRKLVN